jgi:hypothetical protein
VLVGSVVRDHTTTSPPPPPIVHRLRLILPPVPLGVVTVVRLVERGILIRPTDQFSQTAGTHNQVGHANWDHRQLVETYLAAIALSQSSKKLQFVSLEAEFGRRGQIVGPRVRGKSLARLRPRRDLSSVQLQFRCNVVPKADVSQSGGVLGAGAVLAAAAARLDDRLAAQESATYTTNMSDRNVLDISPDANRLAT